MPVGSLLPELLNSGQVPEDILRQMEAARDPAMGFSQGGGFVQRGNEQPAFLPPAQQQVNPATAPRMGENPYPDTPTMPTVADLVPEDMRQSFLRSMESKHPGISRFPAERVPLQALGKEWEDRYYRGLNESQEAFRDQRAAQAAKSAEKRLTAAEAREARLAAKAEQEKAQGARQEEARLEGSILAADRAIEAARNAYSSAGILSAGLVGGMTKWIPGSPALNLDELIEPIRAITSFEQLNRMKEASRTGGALGQIAVRELELLSASVASLNTSQGPEQLKDNLRKVVQHFTAWKEKVKKAWEVEGAPSEGWTDAKEQRYQELLRKRGAGGAQ